MICTIRQNIVPQNSDLLTYVLTAYYNHCQSTEVMFSLQHLLVELFECFCHVKKYHWNLGTKVCNSINFI